MSKQATIPTTGVTIYAYHFRHVAVLDTSKTPIKKLWEATQSYGAEHAAAIKGTTLVSPKAQCEQWLKDNGYKPLDNTPFWEKL